MRTVAFDPAVMLSAAIDALVESWVDQVTDTKEDAMRFSAEVYESIAKAMTIKAALAKGR